MQIIELKSENVKRLTAVAIKPTGPLVRISGANGSGKTSILDSLWWGLGGVGAIQSDPIRHGADKARITIRLGPHKDGDLVVKRVMTRGEDGKSVTHSLSVESGDGAKYGSPQKMLDALVDKLSFDPLDFTRRKPADQLELLKTFVKGFDFAEHKARFDAAFAKRTEVNRIVKQIKASAEAIAIDRDAPAEFIDVDSLATALMDGGNHNAALVREQGAQERIEQEAAQYQREARAFRAEADDLREKAEIMDGKAESRLELAAKAAARLAEMPEIGKPIDTADLQNQIRNARGINEKIKARKDRAELMGRVVAEQQRAYDLTRELEALEIERRKKIGSAELPVPGIGFAEDGVTLNGVPFEQASDAEQLRASMALAMAMNPTLRILRVRDGSLLDSASMKIVEEMAKYREFQVWIEEVSDGDGPGIIIEDGHVRGAALAAE